MVEFFVKGEDRDSDGVAIRGDSLLVKASNEEGAILKFKSIVPGSMNWFFEVTKV